MATSAVTTTPLSSCTGVSGANDAKSVLADKTTTSDVYSGSTTGGAG
jgi:hypothetical protein